MTRPRIPRNIGGHESGTDRAGRLTSHRLALAVAAVALLTLSACSAGAMPGGMGPGMHARSGPDNSAPPPTDGGRPIEVVAGDFWFSPDSMTVGEAESLNLTVRNDGRVYHDLSVESLGIVVPVEPGASAVAGIRFSEPGTYSFICSVPGHAEAGMRGSFIVAAAGGG